MLVMQVLARHIEEENGAYSSLGKATPSSTRFLALNEKGDVTRVPER